MTTNKARKSTASTTTGAVPPDTITTSQDMSQNMTQDTPEEQLPVKLIVFDMGHVFIDFKFEAVCQGFCDRAGIELADFKPVVKGLSKLGYEIGQISTADFLAFLNKEIKAMKSDATGEWSEITIAEFHDLWNYNFTENVEMAALLQDLKGRHRLALLSNTNESHFESLESKFKVTRHFELVYLSYVIGFQKPDLKIYQHVIDETGINPGSIVFIDDRQENIDAALELGIVAIRFENPNQLKQRLRLLNLLD